MKRELESLSQSEIEARVRGLQFKIKDSQEQDSRSAARATQLLLELAGRGVDLQKRKIALIEPKHVRLN